MAADPAREGLGGPGMAGCARRLRLEPDPALHLQQESTLAGAPTLSPMGIKMVAHAIIGFGTEEQKNFFLPASSPARCFLPGLLRARGGLRSGRAVDGCPR